MVARPRGRRQNFLRLDDGASAYIGGFVVADMTAFRSASPPVLENIFRDMRAMSAWPAYVLEGDIWLMNKRANNGGLRRSLHRPRRPAHGPVERARFVWPRREWRTR